MANASDQYERIVLAERAMERFLRRAYDRRRPGWIPENAPELTPEGTDLVLYPWQLGTAQGIRYGLVGFMGRQSKPYVNYTYRSEAERDRRMNQFIESRRAQIKQKLDEQVAKREFKTSLFYGDVLCTSWGYDQTNVDFYEVVEVVGPQMIAVRQVAAEVVKEDGHSEQVVPVPGQYIGRELRVRVQRGDKAKIEGHYASPWNGKPVFRTGPYAGH